MKTQNLQHVMLVTLIALWGCASDGPEPVDTPPALQQTGVVSDCGGFASAADPADEAVAGYCGAERLQWSHDADSATLQLRDSRVLLNCCGVHDIAVELVDDVYVVTETDAPEGLGGRCDCMCVFDFDLEIEGLRAEGISLRLQRHETDVTAEPVVIWEGELDLGLGSETVEVDDSDLGMWCEEPEEEVHFSGALSECGGNSAEELDPDDAYCDAERLHYEHDAETGTLELRDARILLNCCGERSVDVDLVDGVYVIRELDLPEGGEAGGRCNCMCVFDFDISIEDVPAELVRVRLTRDEDEGASTVWEGSLDLTSGAGEIEVDATDVGMWCGE